LQGLKQAITNTQHLVLLSCPQKIIPEKALLPNGSR
jgi:hypothetical protein